ncbi:hypothetical protein [Kordiimonas sp.]|uniref:hypothetical protein n=1 Tax=Kordiimonas sp. TaxID=1970157 RepID=UPI003A8F164F
MLEEVALSYVNQNEDELRLIGYGIVITGAILAALTHNHRNELARAPYFVYSGLLFFVTSVTQLVWLGSIPAMIGGYLWVFMLVDVLTSLAVGYGFGVIAMARSRDAYGHGRLAVLAFVPLANFWLLLVPSKTGLSANRPPTAPLLSGGLGIATGVVLLFAGLGVASFVRLEGDRMAQGARHDPIIQELGIAFVIQTNGLEAALQQMAAEVPSQKVDETTTLLRVEARATTLRYVYQVDTDAQNLPESVRRGLTKHNCTYDAMAPVLQAGAAIEHFYGRPDGTELGTVIITQAVCEAPEPKALAKPTEADITRMIEASPANEMYRALKGYYPEDAKFFLDSMTALLAGGADKEEAFSKMLTVGAEIRRRHAANLRAAPDQSLWAILQAQTQMIAALDDDPMLCNRVVMFGAGVIPEDERHRIMALMDAASLLFRAMFEGEHSPVERTPATEDDWSNLLVDFYAAGGTDEELDLVMQPDIQSPQLCGAMLRFLRVLTDASFPGADRLRAEVAAAMNEG